MAGNNQYDPEVYKRLELVRKQFQHDALEQKKQASAERRQRILSRLGQNKVQIARLTTFTLLAMLVIAVIMVAILK